MRRQSVTLDHVRDGRLFGCEQPALVGTVSNGGAPTPARQGRSRGTVDLSSSPRTGGAAKELIKVDAPAAAPIGFGHSGATTRKPGSGCSVARSVMSVVLVLLLVATLLPSAARQVDTANLQTFLRTQLHLSDTELSALNQGRPVVKNLPATMKREMTTVGGVRIGRGALARFVNQFKTLEGFRTSPFVLQIGRFSEPPQLSDLDALTLDADDIDALRTCRVGACDVQLAAGDIRRFKTEVNWESSTAARDATALYKTILVAHLTEYRAGGRDRLVQYHDREAPLRLTTETMALLDARPSLLDHTPAFRDYLRRYPTAVAANTEDFHYWSKEAFGFKPIISLNHVSLYTPGGRGDVMIVTTQIYASHYMEGSVAINALIPDSRGEGSDFYWLYLNRCRVGRLGGLLGALSRPIVQRRARAGLTRSLLQTKQRLEASR
jgi:hypothetical protein